MPTDLYIKYQRLPSTLVPGATQIKTLIVCPQCATDNDDTREPFNCSHCGLRIHFDLQLFVFRNEPEAAA